MLLRPSRASSPLTLPAAESHAGAAMPEQRLNAFPVMILGLVGIVAAISSTPSEDAPRHGGSPWAWMPASSGRKRWRSTSPQADGRPDPLSRRRLGLRPPHTDVPSPAHTAEGSDRLPAQRTRDVRRHGRRVPVGSAERRSRGEQREASHRPRATQRLDRLRHPSLRPLASSTISPSATAARTRRLSNDEKASPPAPAASRSVMAAARWTASKPRSA